MHRFLTTLDTRFDGAIDLVAQVLTKETGEAHEPVRLRSYPVAPPAQGGMDVIVGAGLQGERRPGTVVIPEPEHLNSMLAHDPKVQDVLRGMLREQSEILLYPFTTVGLPPEWPGVRPIGPQVQIATPLDSKLGQRDFFAEHGVVCPPWEVAENEMQLSHVSPARRGGAIVVSREHGSGGVGTEILYDDKDVIRYVRDQGPFASPSRFLVSQFINPVASPNATGYVVDQETVLVLSIADQLLQGLRYLGNVFPSALPATVQDAIRATTRRIGAGMAERGFRGFFGCDFIVDRDGAPWAVDLNPRRQGGFLCNLLALASNRPDLAHWLVARECGFGAEVPNDMQAAEEAPPFAWAHQKVRPPLMPFHVRGQHCYGSMQQVFSAGEGTCSTGFFSVGTTLAVGGMVGCAAAVAPDRAQVLTRLANEVARTRDAVCGNAIEPASPPARTRPAR